MKLDSLSYHQATNPVSTAETASFLISELFLVLSRYAKSSLLATAET
jgi:hypothetical protein